MSNRSMETGVPNPQFEISTAKRQTLTDLNVQVFDPTENTSLWSKWRTAVNAQLYNKTQLREQHKQLDGFSDSFTEAPLSEYLSVSTVDYLSISVTVPSYIKEYILDKIPFPLNLSFGYMYLKLVLSQIFWDQKLYFVISVV